MEEKDKSNRREVLSDRLLVGGGVAVSVGVGLLHIAAGIIVAGLLAMLFGYLISLGGEEE